MNINILMGEITALLAWICVIFSYWKNKDNTILYFNILSVVFFSINYYFLGAHSGIFVCIFEIIRDWLYTRLNPKKVFLYTIPIYVIIGIFTYEGFLSLFSIFASLHDGYALTYKEKKVVYLGIITYSLWLIYDLIYFSVPNVIAESLLIISNITILIKVFKIKILSNNK